MCKYECYENCYVEPKCILECPGVPPKVIPEICPMSETDHEAVTWVEVPQTQKAEERNDSADAKNNTLKAEIAALLEEFRLCHGDCIGEYYEADVQTVERLKQLSAVD